MDNTTKLSTMPSGSVVVGVDGSHHSDLAMRWAAAQAHREHRSLTLVHAYGIPIWSVPPGPVLEVDGLRRGVEQEGRRLLADATATVGERHPGVEVLTVIAETDPRVALLEVSEHAHLLVLGSRGRGPTASMLLGSVSVYVAQRSTCPTVVCRPPSSVEHASTAEDPARRPVLVGTDGGPVSAAALDFAFQQAAQEGLPLTVVHCFDDAFAGGYGVFGMPDPELDDLDAQRRLLAESVAGLREKHPDVEVTFELGRGGAARYLSSASERASLLVVGSRHRPGHQSFAVDAVSRPVLEHATSAVAIVPAFL